MPDVPAACPSPCDEGPLHPSQPRCHSFVVPVDRKGEETWIVDPLLLQPVHNLAVSFYREGFVLHSMEKGWTERVAQKLNCS